MICFVLCLIFLLFFFFKINSDADSMIAFANTQALYDDSPEPKQLFIVPDSTAHAQHLFDTDDADRVLNYVISAINSQ